MQIVKKMVLKYMFDIALKIIMNVMRAENIMIIMLYVIK